MKILTFSASNHANSINQALAKHASNQLKSEFQPEAEIEILDLNDYEMPIFSVDRENAGGIPALAQQFFNKIGEANAIIVSFAEYNGNYTSAWKNIFDWMSRIDMSVFQDKPMLAMATSTGARGGASVLDIVTASASFFGMNIISSMSVPSFSENFDLQTGKLTNAELSDQLHTALAAVNQSISK